MRLLRNIIDEWCSGVLLVAQGGRRLPRNLGSKVEAGDLKVRIASLEERQFITYYPAAYTVAGFRLANIYIFPKRKLMPAE
jgi:hypothetical protein